MQLWLDPAPNEPLTGDLLEKWLQKGPKKLTIDDETEFVDPPILKGVLDAKVRQQLYKIFQFWHFQEMTQRTYYVTESFFYFIL